MNLGTISEKILWGRAKSINLAKLVDTSCPLGACDVCLELYKLYQWFFWFLLSLHPLSSISRFMLFPSSMNEFPNKIHGVLMIGITRWIINQILSRYYMKMYIFSLFPQIWIRVFVRLKIHVSCHINNVYMSLMLCVHSLIHL